MYAYEGINLGLGLKGEGQYTGVSGALLETADELLQTSSAAGGLGHAFRGSRGKFEDLGYCMISR